MLQNETEEAENLVIANNASTRKITMEKTVHESFALFFCRDVGNGNAEAC